MAAVRAACTGQGEWPARIAAGVYAGIDFAIANPAVVEADSPGRYDELVKRLSALFQADAPVGSRLPGSRDEALVAGIVGVVGDHIRLGRVDRLSSLRPDLVLMILLPYLGFVEAQRWANHVEDPPTESR